MSHLKERAEKICLNCNAQLHGTYCHICGQENIEPKETAWHLVTHFFNDITHFDGKFFSTLGLLITRPGYLSFEYYRGRRASYLNPIRMYVFTSAIFFLIFFSFFKANEKAIIDNTIIIDGKSFNQIKVLSDDSLRIFTIKANKGKAVERKDLDKYFEAVKNSEGFHLTGNKYTSRAQYDSVLKAGYKDHNWLEQQLIYKEIAANQKFQNNRSAFFSSFVYSFVHSFPQMLFVSLPLFTFILKLIYVRRRNYYYVSHGIFSIHFYIFIFIALLFLFGLGELKNVLHWHWLIFFQRMIGFAILFYLYKAMRKFYQQGRAKTILKFLLLYLLSFFMIAILFFIFLLLSFMKI